MKITRTFSLLFATLILWACYVDVYELGSSSSAYYSEAYSAPHSSSSSLDINKKDQDSLRYDTVYATIKVGSLIWMAQNLNAEPSSGKGHWWCTGNMLDNCRTYGKLYDWEAAMDACPSGWRLPSKGDFENLSSYLLNIELFRESWWNATLGGFRYENSGDYYSLNEGYWWSSTDKNNIAYYANYKKNGTKLEGNYFEKPKGLSVRCVK